MSPPLKVPDPAVDVPKIFDAAAKEAFDLLRHNV
jgi:hypothetical protein